MARIFKGQKRLSDKKEYWAIKEATRRCEAKTCKAFKHYGGRGIKVCDCVRNPQNFMFWLGPKPTNQHSLDRINNDGNYCACKGNLRWTTRDKQTLNQRPKKRKNDLPKGVYLYGDKQIQTVIILDKKRVYLGSFPSIEEAHQEFLKYYFIIYNSYPPEFY